MNAVPAFEWARSGLMHLTGPAHGAPLVPQFDVMSGVSTLLGELRRSAVAAGSALQLDARALTQRATVMQLGRGGAQSCNRSCRLLEARDGWIALNLPRYSDLELLPAWLGMAAGADSWQMIERAVRQFDVAELDARSEGLPLAFAAVPAGATESAETLAPASAPTPAPVGKPFAPLVVDLSSLWAGPLCGQLLRQAGARVIKVESTTRMEPMRATWPQFFDQLNAGKQSVVLDFNDALDRARLKRLVASADIVISSARPRAVEQLDLYPDELIGQNPALIWIAITAHGWHGAAGQRVGFGDDAAVAAGLIAMGGDGRPTFLGDAMADPLTGIAAATTALRAWQHDAGGLYDLSLKGTARRVAGARRMTQHERGLVQQRGEQWWLAVDQGESPVLSPQAPDQPCERAAPAGAHTRQIFDELNRIR